MATRSDEPGSAGGPAGAAGGPAAPRRAVGVEVGRALFAVAVAALLALILTDFAPTPDVRLVAGEIADRDLRASRDFQVEDRELTIEARRRAEEQVTPVFKLDAVLSQATERRLRAAFALARESLGDRSTPRAAGEISNVVAGFRASLGRVLPPDMEAAIAAEGFSPGVEEQAVSLLLTAMRDSVILSRDVLPAEGPIAVLRSSGNAVREELLKDPGKRVKDLAESREAVALAHLERLGDRPAKPSEQAARALAQALVAPNLAYDASTSQARRDEARLAVQPVFKAYKRGEVIVRSGEVVKPRQAVAAEVMLAGRSGYRPGLHLLSITCFLALFLTVLVTFATRYIRKFARAPRDLFVLSVLLLASAGGTRIGVKVSSALADHWPTVPETAWWYALPVPAAVMLVRVLMNSETAIVFAAIACAACGWLLDRDLALTLYLLIGSLAAAGGLAHASERGRVFRAGVLTALVNGATAIALALVRFSSIGYDPGQGAALEPVLNVAFGVAGGLVSGVIVLGLVPLFEGLGYLTDIKLLELSNLNHPLLREMIVRAPGTYHHSMVVGQLSEAAAESIGARALLARVGCYFHDVGKTQRPLYFIENQRDGDNPHDRLSPQMSALIITGHVKDGIELGRKHGLPQAIVDLIPQHHGTSLVSFFYNKAKQQEDPSIGRVDDADFRYPGPKPQTREAGILMLADAVEAATRSLRDPNPGAIKARVEKIVTSVVADGQLDECPLTLADLHTVSETFVAVLIGIHHHRIEYPEPRVREPRRGLPLSAVRLEGDGLLPPPPAGARGSGGRRAIGQPAATSTVSSGDGPISMDVPPSVDEPFPDEGFRTAEGPALTTSGEIGAAEASLIVMRTTAGMAARKRN